jgi:AcrR family transcriptional regulator|nr:TetR/AcrR family transcriptional regulator [uncultured Emticicia sp.]
MTQKDRIIEVSLKQFLEHGIKQMTIQKLIEPLGLSSKTVYKYFADKEDLLKQCLFLHYTELAERFTLLEKTVSNPVAGILLFYYELFNIDFGINHTFYYDLNFYYPQLQDLIIENFSSKGRDKLNNIIVEGLEEGFFIRDIKLDIFLETMMVLYVSITRNSKLKQLNYSPIILMQNTLEVYLRGVCTEKGLISMNDFKISKN